MNVIVKFVSGKYYCCCKVNVTEKFMSGMLFVKVISGMIDIVWFVS